MSKVMEGPKKYNSKKSLRSIIYTMALVKKANNKGNIHFCGSDRGLLPAIRVHHGPRELCPGHPGGQLPPGPVARVYGYH